MSALPNKRTDDGYDQQNDYCDYITRSPLGDPAEFIVDAWLDEFKLDPTHDQASPFRLASLRMQMLYVLRANCDELERAENAARMEGMPSFSEWLEDR